VWNQAQLSIALKSTLGQTGLYLDPKSRRLRLNEDAP
jgi:hypothetical protein